MNPAIMAVDIPAAALIPEVMPNPIASGSATIATVTPAIASLIKSERFCGKSLLVMNLITHQFSSI